MTLKFNNVFIKDTATTAGKYEKDSPLVSYFDLIYDDLYNASKTLEQAEIKMQKDSINILLNKTNINLEDICLFLGGDLLNQIAATNMSANSIKRPFIGLYNACATSAASMIVASSFLENNFINNCLCTTSSHNMTAERQYRFPNEYGGPKPLRSTFTATGAASILLTSEKTDIKLSSATIGVVCDSNLTDPYNMGGVMAIAAASTLYDHLTSLNIEPSYYDLIVTGDLGIYGKEIMINYMLEQYNIDIKNNYNDCGVMLYDLEKQKYVNAGGSGPVCAPLVSYGYIYQMLKKKKFKKVLIITTGAIFSPTTTFQKLSIPSIAHAVSWEVI